MSEILSKDQILISKLTEIILANLGNESFGVKELVRGSGLSRSGLNKKLQAITNKTINQFIRETRLRKAMEMLQNESLTASEVAFKTGFSSPSYFNTCFHEFFGYPPGKVKNGALGNLEEELHVPVTKTKRQIIPFLVPYKLSIPGSIILALSVITIAILAYPKIFKKDKLADLRSSVEKISVAVMPFQNFTSDTSKNFWQDMIQDNLITSLTNSGELKKQEKISLIIIKS